MSCSSYAADIKKWTDENGQVHYGDNPPVKTESESIRVNRPPSDPGKPLPRLSDTRAEEDRSEGNTSTTETPAQESFPETTEEQAATECARAKKDVATLRRSNRIRLKSDDGKVHYMTEEEIAKRISQSQEDIDQFCKDQ
jgi:hypothetical protein